MLAAIAETNHVFLNAVCLAFIDGSGLSRFNKRAYLLPKSVYYSSRESTHQTITEVTMSGMRIANA
jgi:hypothetical protein